MTAERRIVTYQEAVGFEHAERGAYANLDYTPTFRASGIFFALVDDRLDTIVSFMNYWREKNGNPSVSALVTVRDETGRRLRREFFPLDRAVYRLSVRALLGTAERFTGSLEIELFSTLDLKYAFPALEVFYEGPGGVGFVHSNQRVFGGFEDHDRNSSLNPWQTGFDLYCDDGEAGILTVINGPRAVSNSTVALKLYNATGKMLERVVPLGELPAYGTRVISLDDVDGARTFLAGDVGFCKANFDTFGVFTRIACGHLARDGSRFAVTHSYYDCSTHADYDLQGQLPAGEYACFLPFNLVRDLDLDLVFYPIYAPSTLVFSLDAFAADGERRARIEKFATFDAAGTAMLRLDVRRLLARHGVAAGDGLYCLEIESVDGRIPARIAFGMNYRRGRIGCNINSSMLMNRGYGLRRRIYLWGPLMPRDGGHNLILVSHLSKVVGARETAELELTIYDASGVVARRAYQTRSGTALNIDADALLAAAGHRPAAGAILWYTLESSCPNYLGNQLHVSRAGYVGGDHSF